MLNHARTLLLNYAGPHTEDIYTPGDVYIPPYSPVVLPEELQAVHTLLFGRDPDYYGLVYRADQYMGVLHSTEFAPYVYAMDTRITYNPDNLTVMDEGLFGVVISGPTGLHVNGTWAAAGATGRIATLWKVTVLTTNSVEVRNLTAGTSIAYSSTDVKRLIGSDFVLGFDSQPFIVGQAWYIRYTARPQPDLGTLLATVKALPPATMTAVFGPASTEPDTTFYNLFTKHTSMPYQLSGFLFAVIQRTEDIRTHGGL